MNAPWLLLFYAEVGLCLFLLLVEGDRLIGFPPAELNVTDWLAYLAIGIFWPVVVAFYVVVGVAFYARAGLAWLLSRVAKTVLSSFQGGVASIGGLLHAVLTNELGRPQRPNASRVALASSASRPRT
jgi:hypothetical protein